MKTPPCKDFPFRQIGCHTYCESYKEYQKENTERLEKEHLKSQITGFCKEMAEKRFGRKFPKK